MDKNTLDRVNDLIHTTKDIAVVLCENPSLDTTAAGLSLYLSLSKAGKKVHILCPTLPTVSLGNLVGIDKVKQGFESSNRGLIISLPYQQGAIEKISYDIVGDRINLTVVPGQQGLTFTTDEITYQSPNGRTDLIFAINIPSESQVGALLVDMANSDIVNIDYSPENSGYGTVALVDVVSFSSSEIVTNLLTSLNLPIDVDIAQNLLAGIIDKTQNFQNEDTSTSAFELAAFLMQKGARRDKQKPKHYPQLLDTIDKPLSSPVNSWVRTSADSKTPGNLKSPEERGKTPLQPQRNFGGGKTSTNVAKTPKDWFEPRIYKGSTPVS